MKDGVIKHDGTSRLIKANLPATYEAMRAMAATGALPMDILFNAAGWDILPDFLNKENLLTDKTAALFGLGADAVPDDVFDVLSRFHGGLGNEHVWRKETSSAFLGSIEDVSLNYARANGPSYYEGAKATVKTVAYADEIDMQLNLVNPQTVDVSFNLISQGTVPATFFNGKYIAASNGLIYHVENTGDNLKATEDYVKEGNAYAGYYSCFCAAARVIAFIPEFEYVNSADPNAFPIDDGFVYRYIGKMGDKFQSGFYVGTGAYGASNPNTLTLDFEPQIVFIFSPYEVSNICILINGAKYYANGSMATSSSNVIVKWGKTVSWYGADATSQYNNTIYKYIAIG